MINYNGNLVSATEHFLSVDNRAFRYGDGVFDISKYSMKKVLFWEDHYLRLMAGMRIMRMEIPMSFSMEYLEEEIVRTVTANGLEDKQAKIRISIFRQNGGNYTPLHNQIDYLIEVEALAAAFYVLNDEEYEVELFKDFYLQPDLLANVKHTNQIVNVLGSIFAQENEYQNCILLNSDKNIAGMLNANLFVVQGNTLKTPQLSDGAMNGITRKKLIEAIRKTNDFTLEERTVSPFELQKADELFLTNTHEGIQSVSKYRKKEFTNTTAIKLLGKLNTLARLG